MGKEEAVKKTYIVWVDYYSEGWAPRGFDTEAEVIEFIEGGGYGQPMVITKPLNIGLKDD